MATVNPAILKAKAEAETRKSLVRKAFKRAEAKRPRVR
jgi:hypothetical protein